MNYIGIVTRAWVFVLCAGCGFSPHGANRGSGSPDAPAMSCTAGAKECDGRVVRTCGNDGTWDPTQDVTCQFTCANAECVAPSNIDLPTVAACGSSAPVLDPGPTGTITYEDAPHPELACAPACGAFMTIASTKTVGNEAWFCVASINLQAGAMLVLPATGVPTTALGLIVDGTATIAGRIAIDGGNATGAQDASSGPGGVAGPGGFAGASQDDNAGLNGSGSGGGGGGKHTNCDNSGNWIGGGGGGGGNFEAGGTGGNGGCSDSTVQGGSSGDVAYSANLAPLVGGGGGGGGGDATGGVGYGWPGGGGGGAIQIAARQAIAITGEISARGGNGYGDTVIDGGGGGGGGGGVLLESPMVMIAGSIVVDGGAGGRSGAGAGGAGSTGTYPPQPGLSFNNSMQGGSGGGGGGGLVQLRTVNASCAGGISPVSACVLGPLLPP